MTSSKCGICTIVGRPNVGKSSLLNAIMAKKVSITADKPQTTRHRVQGIYTNDNVQIVFADTPGIHFDIDKPLNQAINQVALDTLQDSDCILFVVESFKWTKTEKKIAQKLNKLDVPVILLISKSDLAKSPTNLIPFVADISKFVNPEQVIPFSNTTKTNLSKIIETITEYIPTHPHLFPEEYIDDNVNFVLCEILREKIVRCFGAELPYVTAVTLEEFARDEKITKIIFNIWVETQGQKKMVIGKNGDKLKSIGKQARLDIESMLKCKVYISTWVKVKPGWSKNTSDIKTLGGIH